ncbi:MAG: aryl-alcohol dehydrogenase-like predicted oxidoreductase [Haloarculaceae archaeon]|jgi:aryl-alcohol dehydrogenase-like predicted oxidoreductase
MDYTTLGDTGMDVSRICLGCWSLGLDSSSKEEWSVGEAESAAVIERALDLGINFFDTSNSYSWGDSERVLGQTLSAYDRDELVVASKVRFAPEEDAHRNATGLSRKTVEQELSNSLDRLGMDTLDLYQTHRWDDETPIEETLRALDDAVRRGQVRYVGASSMWAYQFAEAVHTSDRLGLERFATMQNHYNLVYREEEREMLPLCDREDVGVIPWSPLAQGYLARPDDELTATTRGADVADRHGEYRAGGGPEINARVEELADDRGVSMAQVALAWVLHQDTVDAPIIGVSSVEHLEDAVEALEVDLSESDLAYLEEPYEPLPVSGHE